MASHNPPILGRYTQPDNSGNVTPENAAASQTNDLIPQSVWRFKDTATRIALGDRFRVPANFNNTPRILIGWSSTVITNATTWGFAYSAATGNDAQTLDPSAYAEEVTVTQNAPSAANRLMLATITGLTAANFTPGAMIQYVITRRGDLGSDTLIGDTFLWDVRFDFQDL